jgi:hypothetical protein
MIDTIFYDYIRLNLTYTESFVFGSAEGFDAPYIIMFKVTDPERPNTLCQKQGDSGEALFQFSAYYGGNTSDPNNAANTVVNLEAFKTQVATIKGIIGTSPNDYRIWSNVTTGVKLLRGGDGVNLLTYGAFFETTIRWEKL